MAGSVLVASEDEHFQPNRMLLVSDYDWAEYSRQRNECAKSGELVALAHHRRQVEYSERVARATCSHTRSLGQGDDKATRTVYPTPRDGPRTVAYYEVDTVLDVLTANCFEGQKMDTMYMLLLWRAKRRGRGVATWEEMGAWGRSMGEGWLVKLMSYVMEILKVSPLVPHASKTAMGYDHWWMDPADRSVDHIFGHDLSHEFADLQPQE
ncbi:hypothetical protein FOA52_009547 [Chlamydomonas sp. UWO 241]|nr:hypothetical protein FOA52_009547 [Chlamydomonas sp. UWO 241]